MFSDIHDNNILNIYEYGSVVYQTANECSDHDYIIVVDNNIWHTDHLKDGKNEYNIYTKSEWDAMAQRNSIEFCECYFLNPKHKIKETYLPEFEFQKENIRREFSHVASNSWVKCKKKLVIEQDFAPRIAKKSLWHSFRILMYGIQMLQDGRISDYTCANDLYDEIVNNPINDWTFYKNKYQAFYNSLKSQFRSFDHHQEHDER